jgi:replicative DNA helicase
MTNLELPHDEQSERAIISCIMLDNDCMFDINLKPNDFYSPHNKYIFDAMSKLHKQNKVIDIITVMSHLNNN